MKENKSPTGQLPPGAVGISEDKVLAKIGRLTLVNEEIVEQNRTLQQENVELRAQLIEAGLMEDPVAKLAEATAEAEGPPAGHEGEPTGEEVEAAASVPPEQAMEEEGEPGCCQGAGPGCCILPKAPTVG